jgi:hypothetical protein
MLMTLRTWAALKIIVFGAMTIATFTPTAYAYYRCRTMGMVSTPCCGEHKHQYSGSETAQLKAESCCSKVTVAIERAPSEIAPPLASHLLPGIAGNTGLALAAPVRSPFSLSWTRARFDSGPPIILQTCSRLM